jgi:hypothetical protein
MAIDTENKRRSIVHISPLSDGNIINQADRQQIAWIYSGILAVQMLGEVQTRLYNVPAEDRVYVVPNGDEPFYNVPAEDRVYEVS